MNNLLLGVSITCGTLKSAIAVSQCVNTRVLADDFAFTCQSVHNGSCRREPLLRDTSDTYPREIKEACSCKDEKVVATFGKNRDKCAQITDDTYNEEDIKGADKDGCRSEADCREGLSCASGKCVGSSAGEACLHNLDCKFGLVCNTGTCATPDSKTQCSTRLDCGGDAMMLCATVAGSTGCFKRFSQADGVEVSNGELCASVDSYNGVCFSSSPKATGTACSKHADCFTNLPNGADSDSGFSNFGAVCQCQGAEDTVPGTCENYDQIAADHIAAHKALIKCVSDYECKGTAARPTSCAVTQCGQQYARANCHSNTRTFHALGLASVVHIDNDCNGCSAVFEEASEGFKRELSLLVVLVTPVVMLFL